MKDYRGTQMPVEWDHDTYHQDDEKIIFYCPNCHEALADFPTQMLDEEVDCNGFSNECVSAFAYEHVVPCIAEHVPDITKIKKYNFNERTKALKFYKRLKSKFLGGKK